MRNKDDRAKRVSELLTNRVKFEKWYEVWKTNEGIVFFDDCTRWLALPNCDGRDLYFWQKDKAEWENKSYTIQVKDTLYHVKSGIPFSELKPIMFAYYEAKKNGNISIFRLD